MAQSSPKDRRIRLLKRERNRAWRELDATWRYTKELLTQFNAAQTELKKYITKYGELPDEPVVKRARSVTEQLDAEASSEIIESPHPVPDDLPITTVEKVAPVE